MQHDYFGREYVKLSDLKPGDKVVCDDGFDCMLEGDVKVVEEHKEELFIKCKNGMHGLDGQDNGDGYCIGIYRVN